MSSKPLPPPPKMSGLTTPANATSSVFTTPSGSSHITSRYNYPTPAAGARVAATTRPAGAASSARGASASSVSTKVAVPPPPPQQQQSVSYETFAPRTAESRYRLARLAALTAGPCFGDSHFGPQSEQKVKVVEDGSGTSTSNSTTSTGVTLAEAMRPPKLSTMKSVHSRNNGSTTTTTSASVDDIIHKTLESTLLTTTKLNSLIQHTSSLRIALHTSLTIANDVTQRHSDLLKHSGELSAAAERLQHEEQILTRRATEVGLPLKHYDAVDRLGVLVGVLFKDGGRVIVRTNAKLHVDNNVDEFMEVLEQIDDAIEFFGESSGGSGGADNKRRERLSKKDQGYESTSSGSAEYYRRACALQDAALELLRVGVADRITQTRTQIQDALTLPRVPIAADKLEASLVYTRFHGISKRSNALISIARKRLDKLGNQSVAATSYEDLLTLCRNTYCGAREALLTSTVRTHMDILRERHGLVGMTRLASVFLIRLCTIETAMYLDFFGDAEKKRYSQKKTKRVLLDSVDEEKSDSDAVTDGEEKGAGDESENSGNISQAFQRKGSSSSHPGAAALTSQIISEDATFRDAEFQSMLGALCSALHRTIRRGLVSVLDLDVLCQVVSVLREERSAANSSPTTLAAARAVSGVIQDAQERLIFCANDALHKEVVRFKPTTNDLNYPGKLLGEKPKVAIIIDGESNAPVDAETSESKPDSAGDAAELSPIDDAFAAQQRVYDSWFPPMRSVLRILSKIFRVVEPRVFEDIALQSVQSCTKSLKDGSIFILKKSGQIHADLILVKHLLILREQLSPFDIQLRSVERQLDFSDAGKAVTRFLANRNRRLFSMSTENALITLLREGVSVQESSVDSKRDLEDCLRSACNDFIENTSSSILGPIAGFVDQCKNAAGSTSTTGSADLINAPFMNGAVVNSLVSTALQNLDGELDNVTKQMTLYLENTATQGILLKPVVRKVTRSLEEVKRFIGEVQNEENGWDANVRTEVLKCVEDFETKVKSKK